jgi:hypothetical protein
VAGPGGDAGGIRWLTVVSPEPPDGPELLLEPKGFEPAETYQKALFEDTCGNLIQIAQK